MDKIFLSTAIFLIISCIKAEIYPMDEIKSVPLGQFPFFAHLVFEIQLYSDEFYNCGGSLIHTRWIITAAHCFPNPDNETAQLIKKDRIHALMGTNKHFNSVEGTSYFHSFVDRVISHKYYQECYDNNMKRVATKYNIALLKTRQSFPLIPFIQTIKIPSRGQRTKACRKAIIIGNGIIKSTGNASEDLLFATTEIYEGQLNVSEWLRSSTVFYTVNNWSKSRFLFTDAGGPFICYHGHTPVLYGIRLGGYNSTENNTNVVITTYESVQKHIAFIKQYIPKILTAEKYKGKNKNATHSHTQKIENMKATANSSKKDFYQVFCLFLFYIKCK